MLGTADLLRVHHETSFFRHLAPAEIAEALQESGFRELEVTTVGGLFVPLGLNGIGGRGVWRALDAVEDWFERMRTSPFRWYGMYRARKPWGRGSEAARSAGDGGNERQTPDQGETASCVH